MHEPNPIVEFEDFGDLKSPFSDSINAKELAKELAMGATIRSSTILFVSFRMPIASFSFPLAASFQQKQKRHT